MTKDRFLVIKETLDVRDDELFEFYKEKGGLVDDFNEFNKILLQLINSQRVIICQGGYAKIITWQSAINKFIEHYNQVYNI